jgi:hypothetical protein
MIILQDTAATWQAPEDMDLIAVSPLDGKVVTGFAQGQFTLLSYFVF